MELLEASSCHRQAQVANELTIVDPLSIGEALRHRSQKPAASSQKPEAHLDHERKTLFKKNPVRNSTHQFRQHFMRTNTESLGVVKFEVGDDGLQNMFAFVGSHFHFVCVFEGLF